MPGTTAWEQYLYRGHSRDELAGWARRMRYFRFCRAYGGHANDGDRLLLALRYEDDADLHALCERFALDLDAKGYQRIAEADVLVIRYDHTLTFTLSGAASNPYEVTEADVVNAERIESLVAPLAERVIDPPIDHEHCVAPGTYPELFRAD